ncbi:MAG: TolC family protein [Candidatus Omnitrophota bacterium]|nr:TolC family protein [Candidatus Omnitrophota bacterium]
MKNTGTVLFFTVFKLKKIEPSPLFILFFIVLFFSSMIIFGHAEEITLTFNEAVAIGLRDNRDILLKTQDVEKAKLKIAAAQAGIFPTLTYTGSWFYTTGLYTKDISQSSSQISLKQYLYRGGRVINSIKYNDYKLEVAQSLLDKTKLEMIFDFSRAYYTLSLSNFFAGLNKAILDNSRQHLDYINARYKNGQTSETDILQAQASLSLVEQAYEASGAQQEAAQALLNNLLSLDKDVLVLPSTEIKFAPKDIAFDQGFLKAMQTRPEIRQFEAQLKADKSAIQVQRAGNLPDIYASWDYYTRSHSVSTAVNTRNWNDYKVIGVTFSWPIFDGWKTKSLVEQAIVDLKQTQLGKTKLIQDIALEVKNAYLSLKNSIDQIKASQADTLFYKQNLSTAEEKFAQGLISSLDRNDAQLKYAVAVFNQQQAVYDYFIAKFGFDKATGGFNEV